MCEAVSPLQSGVSGKTALTATEGILFEAQAPDVCRMTTFDLEKGVRLSVRVEVIEEGAAIISAAAKPGTSFPVFLIASIIISSFLNFLLILLHFYNKI